MIVRAFWIVGGRRSLTIIFGNAMRPPNLKVAANLLQSNAVNIANTPLRRMIDMPVNLENLLRQAATCIDPKKDKGAYAYMIGGGSC
ncbi:MAG: hypothetical protein IPM41_15970 [Sphingomonadales bacterium]|nr:hypothetical protein [Sphingomonadales bacterium]